MNFIEIRAKSEARKSRRAEKVAENAVLPTAPYARQASQEAQGATQSRKSTSRLIRTPVRAKAGKPKRRKKSLFVRLRDQLDKECQAYAAKRDEALGCRIAKAEKCTGKSEVGYHLIPRGKWAVRWNLDLGGIGNIVGACSTCNSGERWHRLDYAEIHRQRFGTDFYDALWSEARKPYHYTSLDLQARLDDVRERMKRLRECAR